jgi:CxxC motif-containing protein
MEDINLKKIRLDLEEQIKAEDIIWNLLKAGKSSVLTYIGATSLAVQIGTASTGTAISTLSGIAARNAMLAWFGGGSLAAGGGGIALGSAILGGITVAPALLMVGFSLAKKGEKALTEAEKKVAEIKGEIKKMEAIQRNINYAREKIAIFNKLLTEISSLIKERLEIIKIHLDDAFPKEKLLGLAKEISVLIPVLKKASQIQVIIPKEFALCREVESIISEMKSLINK